MKSISEENIATLAECSVTGEDGASRKLGSFWEGQRAALVFVRHFG